MYRTKSVAERVACQVLLTINFQGKLKLEGSRLADPECDILAGILMVYGQLINAMG